MFRKKGSDQRGSVTVLVTLLLIPTIVVNGFMVDLARLKLYGNQAVMAADNYGESALAVYDNLLKDLYGLFAMSQNEAGTKALESLDSYMKNSFNPNSAPTVLPHIGIVTGPTTFDGFMPYDEAEIEFEMTKKENSTLKNGTVFSTQLGDFMKFRIVQCFNGEDSEIFSAVEKMLNSGTDAKAVEQKREFDDLAGELLDAVRAFYQGLKIAKQYPAYLDRVINARNSAIEGFEEVVASQAYINYKNYKQNEESVKAAVKFYEEQLDAEEARKKAYDDAVAAAKKAKKDPPPPYEPTDVWNDVLTEQQRTYIGYHNAIGGDPTAARKSLKSDFDYWIEYHKSQRDSEPIDFDSYKTVSNNLETLLKTIKNKFEEVNNKRKELQSTLNDPNVSDDIKSGMEEELKKIDNLFSENKSNGSVNNNSIKAYEDAVKHFKGGLTSFNSYAKEDSVSNDKAFETVRDEYLDNFTSSKQWGRKVDKNQFSNTYDFYKYDNTKRLYDELETAFGAGGDEERAQSKKDEAEKMLDNAENQLSEGEKSDARDIPSNINVGRDGPAVEFRIGKMIGEAASYFDSTSLSNKGNRLLHKFYTVAYDFNMFSNRTTNLPAEGEKKEENEKAVSLTGYELSEKINYLYMAELEYIFGGYKKSDDNLTEARNTILAFRAVMNFAATYTVKEVNHAIGAIRDACSAVNPLLGLAVAAALRLAVATVETLGDWDYLKNNQKVPIAKTKLEHLSSYDKFKSLIDRGDSVEREPAGLTYRNYLMVMLLFLTTDDEIASRTADLIELNVNTAQLYTGKDWKLTKQVFYMSKAYTAIDVKCSVQLDFVVMPQQWASMMLDDPSYSLVYGNEKNKYVFTVTRGY